MNGRVYDPVIGRFVSPDPWIQDPENSQSFNRYSYVWNNPLRYTDPTGETAEEEVTVTGYQSDTGGSWSSGSITWSIGGKNTPLVSVTIYKDQNNTITGIHIKHLPGINVKGIDIGETNAEGGEKVKISFSVKNMKLSASVETTANNLGAKGTPLSVDRKVDTGRTVDPVVAKEVAQRKAEKAEIALAKISDFFESNSEGAIYTISKDDLHSIMDYELSTIQRWRVEAMSDEEFKYYAGNADGSFLTEFGSYQFRVEGSLHVYGGSDINYYVVGGFLAARGWSETDVRRAVVAHNLRDVIRGKPILHNLGQAYGPDAHKFAKKGFHYYNDNY